ncbi:hypothetical protein N7495_004515 [Penicillium taxi]|uniref:uncharacterized protein n=1 Tax=Penicillium taxi TaxID=168475 RepID=UPI00254553F6|nr:uncharacterized protein N7495_004515 [Penicillium taxi]KAJ5899771.1 hypothetical protein N7495_004515 [Penicillium taxi]
METPEIFMEARAKWVKQLDVWARGDKRLWSPISIANWLDRRAEDLDDARWLIDLRVVEVGLCFQIRTQNIRKEMCSLKNKLNMQILVEWDDIILMRMLARQVARLTLYGLDESDSYAQMAHWEAKVYDMQLRSRGPKADQVVEQRHNELCVIWGSLFFSSTICRCAQCKTMQFEAKETSNFLRLPEAQQ